MTLFYCKFFMLVIFSSLNVSGSSLSSLTFVIDDTSSMGNDIDAVKRGATAIFETVVSHSGSQIGNFVLVTFNDRSYTDQCTDLGQVRANTNDRVMFMSALAAISVGGGAYDCEECSMAGIKLGLEQSLPRSTVYVFTDATAKDYGRYEEVKKLAIDKQSQIVFVLTGLCGQPTTSPMYKVYEDAAVATQGQIFNIKKHEVSKVLDYVKTTITGRMDTKFSKTLPAGSSKIPLVIDALMGEVLFSIASDKSNDPTVSLKAPDGSDVYKRIVFDTDKAKVYAFDATKPGRHTLHVSSLVPARAVLAAKSGVDFQHGFSSIKLDSLVDTSSMPAPGAKSHLSIKLNEGDIELKKIQILDINDNVMEELPLELTNNVTKLYTTPKFNPPTSLFKIQIVGYHPGSNSSISRTAPTLVQPPVPLPGVTISPMIPSVVITSGPNVTADYDTPLELTCNVKGYPRPDIVWKNLDKGTVFSPETLSGKDYDYDHINVLSIAKVTESATYTCEAKNPSGADAKQVTVEVIRKRYLKMTTTANNVTAEYENEGTVVCTVDAYPPAEITWYKNDKIFVPDANVEIQVTENNSMVTIKKSTLADEGKYTCEAKNEDTKETVDMYFSIGGLEIPEIDKHVTNVIATKGLGTTIECKVLKGKPKPSINWTFGTTSASLSSMEKLKNLEQIVINNADKVDSGIYQCHAENEVGSDQHQVDLIVEYGPAIVKSDKKESMKVKTGSDVSISCDVDGVPLPQVTWLKNNVEITNSTKFQISNSYTISFVADSSDAGDYVCHASNTIGTDDKTVELYVTEPPEIDKHLTNVIVTKGLSTTIECKLLKGTPKPSISWAFGPTSKTLSPMEKWKNLEEIVIGNADNGIYQCRAENEIGSDQHEVNLGVEYAPTIVNSDKKELIKVKTGFGTSLSCDVDGAPPPGVTWLKNNVEITNSAKFHISDTNTISFIADASDTGDYVCRATNKHGTADKTVELYVTEPPEIDKHATNVIATRGLSTAIECRLLKGKPKPTISWKFGTTSAKLSTVDKWKDLEEIVIGNADKIDSGSYQCEAENDVGVDQHAVNLVVEYVPTIAKSGKKELITAKIGSDIAISCDVDGIPPPQVTWLKNDVEIKSSVKIHISHDYTISFVADSSDTADYKCHAMNKLGTDDKSVEVFITVPPTIAPGKQLNRTLIVGHRRSTLSCKASGTPAPELKWMYKSFDASIPSQEMLGSKGKTSVQLENVEIRHEGNYTCFASNSAGSSDMTYSVHVFEAPRFDSTTETDVFVEKGLSTKLECKLVKGKPKPSLSWFFKLSGGDKDAPTKFEEVLKWKDKESVELKNADKTNTGIYQCRATNTITTEYHDINLLVEYKPEILLEKTEKKFKKAEVGTDVSIPCNVDGSPPLNVTWIKDGVELVSDGKPYTFGLQVLKFTAELSHKGFYVCKATNRLGADCKTVKVDVIESATIVIPQNRSFTILVGSNVMLPCKSSGDPEPTIKWTYQGFSDSKPSTKVLIPEKNNSLSLKHVQIPDEGYYTCTAVNTGATVNLTYEIQAFAPATIVNTYKDRRFIVVEGDFALHINCNATGSPKPALIWSKVGSKLTLGSTYKVKEGTLFIYNVPKDASGTYKCEIDSPRATGEITYEVVVKEYPPLDRAASTVNIEEGQTEPIKCSLPHTNTDQLRWYKDGKLIYSGELLLIGAKVADSGYYSCRVSTLASSHSRGVEVIVGYKPKFSEKIENLNVHMVEGSPVSLNCATDSRPEGQVTWYHDDKKLGSTDAIYNFPTGISSAGKYKCEVTNSFGSISRTFLATQEHCEIDFSTMDLLAPLLLNSNLAWLVPAKKTKNMVIPKEGQVIFFCPKGFSKIPKHTNITAFCNGETKFLINGRTYDYSDIKCNEEVQHTVQGTGLPCMPGYDESEVEKINVGYTVIDHVDTVVYEVCLNKRTETPIYVKQIMQSFLAEDDYSMPWLDADQFQLDFDEAYECANQIQSISLSLQRWFHNVDNCCFYKRQLVGSKDVFPGVPQKSTYSYLNVIPHWSTCQFENWDDMEQRVRNLAKKLDNNIFVWTGTANELSLETSYGTSTNIFISDQKSIQQTVPMFLWKVVQDPVSLSSLAIIQVNVPDLDRSEASKYTICDDKCDNVGWMKSNDWTDLARGYIYCCKLDEFEDAFGLQGVFEQNMNFLLTYTPDHD